MMLRPTMIAIALLLPLATMSAAGAAEDGLRIDRVWARATAGAAKTGAVYFRIESQVDDRLMALNSPVAQETQLHTHRDDNGTMRMRVVEDGLPLTPGQAIELKPGGLYHAMLLGMRRQLTAGESFPLTLFFEKAGPRDVTVKVERLGAMGPSGEADADRNAMHHGAMDHSAMGDGSMSHDAMGHGSMDHGAMDHGAMDHGAMDMGAMRHDGGHPAETPGS